MGRRSLDEEEWGDIQGETEESYSANEVPGPEGNWEYVYWEDFQMEALVELQVPLGQGCAPTHRTPGGQTLQLPPLGPPPLSRRKKETQFLRESRESHQGT